MASTDRAIYVKQNGTWHQVTSPQIKENNAWADVTGGYVKQAGVWQQFFPSAGNVAYTNPGTYTFKVPPGITQLNVDMIGGGGGGGGAMEVGNGDGGGGGGSGGYLTGGVLNVVPGETITIVVGGGGIGGPFVGRTAAAPNGNDGGDSIITSSLDSLSATGGGGGLGGTEAEAGENDVCCFDPRALVTMADGTCKPIKDVQIGDRVLSGTGDYNTVISIETPVLADRLMYKFNDTWAFVSEEHPILTTQGWAAFNPNSWAVEKEFVGRLHKIEVGTTLVTTNGTEIVERIETEILPADYVIYNLLLDGDHTYIVEGYVVHNKGLCFTEDSVVVLKGGKLKKIKDVKIGDYVINHTHTEFNRVVFIEKTSDTNFEFLYTPSKEYKPFATINHPLYINGELSSVDPAKNYLEYPWLGYNKTVVPAEVVPATDQMVYNLWVEGDGTYIVNGYGTTGIIGNGGVLRLMAEQGHITDDRASQLLLKFTTDGKNTVYGAYIVNRLFGKLDIKLVNKVLGAILKDDITHPHLTKLVTGALKLVGAIAWIFKRK